MGKRKRTSYNPEDEECTEEEQLDPYAALAAAFLQRLVWDARGKISTSGGVRDIPEVQYQARKFLQDTIAVEWWVEITGADSEKVIPMLREGS